MRKYILMAFITFNGCATDPALYDAHDNCEYGVISECGQEVLYESEETYYDCFPGNERYGPCETCGYQDDVRDSQNYFDCITCPAGYEIDVIFRDCTGLCVPEGKAIEPIWQTNCMPTSECVLDEVF